MRALVTGSNGFIGHNLCLALANGGWQLLGVDDLSSGWPENTVDGVDYIRARVEDSAHFKSLLDEFVPNVIFHLAAKPRVSFSFQEPYLTAETNLLGTISVLESVARSDRCQNIRVVYASSSSVYGGAKTLPTPENEACHPQSPYALQKYHGEQWCRMFALKFGLDVIALRYFNVFGPYCRFGGAYSAVLAAWMYRLFVNPSYDAFLEGDGTQTRDFTYVDNVIQANILAATHPGRFCGECVNIANGEPHSLAECKSILERISGQCLELLVKPRREGDVAHSWADIRLARTLLGYAPIQEFPKQLEHMASWYANEFRETPSISVQYSAS